MMFWGFVVILMVYVYGFCCFGIVLFYGCIYILFSVILVYIISVILFYGNI